MQTKFKWVDFHKEVKTKYLSIAPKLWWGDDLDVRFYLLKKLMGLKNKKILDIGCNIGITLSFLDKANELFGIEIDEYCVNEARKLNPNANIYQGSMEQLPYEDNSFDVIVMMNVLPYYDYIVGEDIKENFIKNTFNEVHRVLKNDGTLYLTTPNGDSIHYKNTKATRLDIDNALKNFEYTFQGWNQIKPFSKLLPKKYNFIPPKILCKFESIWCSLCKNMDGDIENSKYFYIEARKKL